jgi:hypothetical protein
LSSILFTITDKHNATRQNILFPYVKEQGLINSEQKRKKDLAFEVNLHYLLKSVYSFEAEKLIL